MLEKGNIATNRPLTAIWARAWESLRGSFCLKESLGGCEQKVGRNMASEAHSEEVSDGNEDAWLGTAREWQRTWLDCSPRVLWKVALVSNESRYWLKLFLLFVC